MMPRLTNDDSAWLRAMHVQPPGDLPDVPALPRWKQPRYLIDEADYWRGQFDRSQRAFVRLAWLSGIVISLLFWALVGRWVWEWVG
jgi:hypothetical protein